MIIVSACLLGINCKYSGKNSLNQDVMEFLKNQKGFIAVCPECLGGLPIPRDASEITNGAGEDVILGKSKVKAINGRDVTKKFLKGALKTLEIAKKNNIKLAILKSKSPSCGVGQTCDGTFSGVLIKGDGVTAALLKKHKIKVINELMITKKDG